MINFRGLLFKPLHNIEEMSILLCQALHIKLTKRLLCKELEEHPDFPSLGAVKDGVSPKTQLQVYTLKRIIS